MAVLHINLGDVMSGKSWGISNLDPESTFIIQGLDRGLPMKGSAKMYNGEKKNIFVINSIDKLKTLVEKINNKPEIKTLVLDDLHYIFGNEFAKSAKQKGYEKYTDYFVDYHTLFNELKKLRSDLFIHVLWHCEPVFSGNKIIKYEPKFIGNAVKKYFNPLGLADVVTFSKVEFEDGVAKYGYYTQNFMDDNEIEYPARSPKEMFKELRIENDLKLVEDSYRNYIN